MDDDKILLHVMVENLGSPAIIVNADVAKSTPCKCYPIGDGKKLCFSKGAIGALDQDQRKIYCTKELDITDGKIVKRVNLFREAAKICKSKIEHIPKGERLHPWLECMGEQLEKRGIEI